MSHLRRIWLGMRTRNEWGHAGTDSPIELVVNQSGQDVVRVNALIASEAIAAQTPWPWKHILAERAILESSMVEAYGLSLLIGAAKADVFSFHEMTLGDEFSSQMSVKKMVGRYGLPDSWHEQASTNGIRRFCRYGPIQLEVSANREKVRSNYLMMPDLLGLMLVKHSGSAIGNMPMSGIPDLSLPDSGSASGAATKKANRH